MTALLETPCEFPICLGRNEIINIFLGHGKMCDSCGCTPCKTCGAPIKNGVCSGCLEPAEECICQPEDQLDEDEQEEDLEEDEEDLEEGDDYN